MHSTTLLLIALTTLTGNVIALPTSLNTNDAELDLNLYQNASISAGSGPGSHVQRQEGLVTADIRLSKRADSSKDKGKGKAAKRPTPKHTTSGNDRDQQGPNKKKHGKESSSSSESESESGSDVELGAGSNTSGGKDVIIDCAKENFWEGCNTICAASICLDHTDATGLWITEGKTPIKMKPLVHNKEGISAVHVPGAHDKGLQNVENRVLSGCKRQPPATSAGKDAIEEGIMEIDSKISGGTAKAKSGDEWPPNASKSGGAGALVQVIEESANTGVGRHFSGNMNGYAKLINVAKSKADVCKSIIEDNKERTASKAKFCKGKDHRFVQFEWQPKDASEKSTAGTWHSVGQLPAQYLSGLKHGSS